MTVSEKVVRRLMKEERLVAATSKRRRYGSYMGEISPAPDNLLNRDFRASAPNEKWLTDITEFQIPAGKVYLSPMIDCFDGMVVSWSIGTRPNAELVNTMLDAAIEKVAASDSRPVVHSDRGGHYRWPGWLSRIADAKLTRSMSRKVLARQRRMRGLLWPLEDRDVLLVTGCTRRLTSSLPAWTPIFGGTTRRGSKSHLVLAALSSIAKAWESPFNQSKFSAAPHRVGSG